MPKIKPFMQVLIIAIMLALSWPMARAAIPADGLEELDRVQIYGWRTELWKLRQAIVEAEDRFYERYNELNTRDDFDVRCRVEPCTGTRLTTRTCRALYQENAVQEGAKQAVEVRQRFESLGGYNQGLSPPPPAALTIVARQPEFERRMRKVVRENPELVALLKKRAAAAEALAAAIRRDSEQATATPPTTETPGTPTP